MDIVTHKQLNILIRLADADQPFAVIYKHGWPPGVKHFHLDNCKYTVSIGFLTAYTYMCVCNGITSMKGIGNSASMGPSLR